MERNFRTKVGAGGGPRMVWADGEGNIYDRPGWMAAGRRGNEFFRLDEEDLMPLPEGSELFLLPGRLPLGYRDGDRLTAFGGRGRSGRTPAAVAAFLPPAYTQYYLPAYRKAPGAPVLPLYAYTAVAFHEGGFCVPAVRIDPDLRQDPAGFDCAGVEEGIRELLGAAPGNRLLRHLSRCAREYFCPAARNLFLKRWEAPLPASPACNAQCVGCISCQPSGLCPATQGRIDFVPAPEEIAEVAVGHLARVPGGVVSFGQGCEGEPLLVADTILAAVHLIRKATGNGTVNLNTNGSLPGEVRRLADEGLDAIRVSLNSARPELYRRYYHPRGYGFPEVATSIGAAAKAGVFTSINYFVFPGVTDQAEEVEALCRLIGETGIKMIQWRNLNLDLDLYLETVPAPPGSLGVPRAMALVREKFPGLRHGYFNPAVKRESGRIDIVGALDDRRE